MSYQDLVLGFNKGFDRSVTPFKADIDTAYDLVNLRVARSERGRLEQTPYFNNGTYTAGSYWNGSTTVTESASGGIYSGWFDPYAGSTSLFSNFTMRTAGVQVPIYYQTVSASGDDVHKGVLLTLTNPTALALGQTYEVEIDAATTFKWQKNGGGYTTGVPITTTGVSIDSGKAVIYFLSSTLFTVTDHWTWQRTDCTISPVNAATGIPGNTSYMSSCEYGRYLVWLTHDSRVMIYDPSIGYVRSVGYQPITGFFLKVFQKHLFVGDSSISTASNVYSGQLRCSDLEDIDVFIDTDVNEADVFTFPSLMEGEAAFATNNLQQLFVVANRIHILTGQKVFASAYLGLPTVFDFEEVSTFAMYVVNIARPRVAQATNGVYIIRRDGVWLTDGTTFRRVGAALGVSDLASSVYIVVDFIHNELIIHDATNQIVYVFQENYGTWYTRKVSFPFGSQSPFFTTSSARLTFGGASLHYYTEDITYTGVPIKDTGTGASFTLPSVTSQLVSYGNFAQVKEVEGSWLVARAVTISGMSANYQATSNAIIQLYWGSSTDGLVTATTTDSGAVWTAATAEKQLSYPRFSGRALAFRLDVTTVDTTKPPAGVSIIQYQPHISIPTPTPVK